METSISTAEEMMLMLMPVQYRSVRLECADTWQSRKVILQPNIFPAADVTTLRGRTCRRGQWQIGIEIRRRMTCHSTPSSRPRSSTDPIKITSGLQVSLGLVMRFGFDVYPSMANELVASAKALTTSKPQAGERFLASMGSHVPCLMFLSGEGSIT